MKPPEPYQTYTEVCVLFNVDPGQVQMSQEADRILENLYDQMIGRNGDATALARATAMVKYCEQKKAMAAEWFSEIAKTDKPLYNRILNFSYNSALRDEGEGQFGQCGRFHRRVQQMYSTIERFSTPYQRWLQQIAGGIIAAVDEDAPPYVSETSLYRINSDPIQINDGSVIATVEGDRLRMYTNGVGYTNHAWSLDGGATGNTEERLNISSIEAADAGVYINTYTNANDVTASDTFTVTVS